MADRRIPELIFDVGMHDGDDTAYYLSKGYSVVAIEANPELCVHAPQRFRGEIEAGRLVIEEVAISTGGNVAPFYINEGESQFSALDSTVARRGGLSIGEISVQTISPLELFQRYGVPFYMKVDIERADSTCLDALQDLDEAPGLCVSRGACARLVVSVVVRRLPTLQDHGPANA